MATVEVCDICGQPIVDYEDKKVYKIKKPKKQWDWLGNYKTYWFNVSAHQSCIKVLLAARDKQITNEMILEELRQKVAGDNI